MDDTSLTFRPAGRDSVVWNIGRAELTRMQVSHGKRPQMLKGALLGVAVGASLGALIALATEPSGTGSWFFDDSEAFEIAAGVTVFGATGLIAGSAIGLATPTERWKDVSLAAGTPLGDRSSHIVPSIVFSVRF